MGALSFRLYHRKLFLELKFCWKLGVFDILLIALPFKRWSLSKLHVLIEETKAAQDQCGYIHFDLETYEEEESYI